MPETQPTFVAEYIPHCSKLIRVARADLVAFKSGTEIEGKRNAMKIRNRNIPKGRAGNLAAKAICFLVECIRADGEIKRRSCENSGGDARFERRFAVDKSTGDSPRRPRR